MQDRRVCADGVIKAVDLAGAERQLDAAQQGRVRVGLKIGINEVRNLAGLAVQLDQVGPIECSQVSSGASLVNAEKWATSALASPNRQTLSAERARRAERSRFALSWSPLRSFLGRDMHLIDRGRSRLRVRLFGRTRDCCNSELRNDVVLLKDESERPEVDDL
jgi:hypothetical protein